MWFQGTEADNSLALDTSHLQGHEQLLQSHSLSIAIQIQRLHYKIASSPFSLHFTTHALHI